MGRVLVWLIAAISFLTVSLRPAASEPRHAIAMQGEPALPADYQHFNYVNPDAPKGGSITYCVVGSFDNLNPFILKSLRTTARGMIDTIYGNLVFEPLMQRNYDEAFSLYGLLADSADMDPERKSIEFHLNPNAKWSDGEPVTPEDVLFTYDVFTDKGRPPYSDRMSLIAKLEKTGDHSVRFTFNEKANRETPLIIALTPIIPKHGFDKETFDKTTLKPVIGSGPYTVDKVQPGQRIVFKRNPDYWGKDVPAKRGFDNYDQITIEYFLNDNAMTEAFKKGICATDTETDPVKRDRDMDFPAFRKGDVVAETFDTGIPPVVTGLPVQHQAAEIFQSCRAARAGHALRLRMGQQEPVRRQIQPHHELLAEFRAFGTRPSRRRQGEGAAGALPRPRAGRCHGRQLAAAGYRRLGPGPQGVEGGVRPAEVRRLQRQGRDHARSRGKTLRFRDHDFIAR